jgi:hypothetical protein
MPTDHPSMSHAFGARLHDHSHDAGFATASNPSTIRNTTGDTPILDPILSTCTRNISPNDPSTSILEPIPNPSYRTIVVDKHFIEQIVIYMV